MEKIIAKNYDDMSDAAAEIFAGQIREKTDSVLGLATGTTPIGLYERLIKRYTQNELDFSAVRTVNLDEYCDLPPENENSYRYFMNTQLFNHVNIDKRNTHVPDGLAKDPGAEGERYDTLVERLGGIDVQLLGIGNNGHIGFNEPADVFPSHTHRVQLTESTIQANSRLFENASDVPRFAMTLGIKNIMLSRRIVLLAGADKRDIIAQALEGDITPKIPASILQVHPCLTVIIAES